MKSKVRFSQYVVSQANAQLIQQRGRPTRLPPELLGVVSYKPKTLEEIKTAFASAYATLRLAK
jgi:hypothetical protein